MLTLLPGCISPSLDAQKVILSSSRPLGAHQKTVNKSAADTKHNSISNKNTTCLKTHNLSLYDLEAGLAVTVCLDKKAFCRVIIGMPSLTFI